MKCPMEMRDHEELLAYCARSLDAERTAVLEEHIRGCSPCQEFCSAQNAVWETLDRWEAPPVSADFDRKLYQRIEHQVSFWDRIMQPFRPLLVRQGLPVAAAAALLLVAGFLVQHPTAVTPVSHPESAQVEAMPPEQVEHAIDEMETIREFNRLIHPELADPKM